MHFKAFSYGQNLKIQSSQEHGGIKDNMFELNGLVNTNKIKDPQTPCQVSPKVLPPNR